MANIKISELPLATNLTENDVIPVVQSGTTFKTFLNNIITLVSQKLNISTFLQKGNYVGTAENLNNNIETRAVLYKINSRQEFPTCPKSNSFYLDIEKGMLYLGWEDPNYFGDPAYDCGTFYKSIGGQDPSPLLPG